jgi:hypothetical protein
VRSRSCANVAFASAVMRALGAGDHQIPVGGD